MSDPMQRDSMRALLLTPQGEFLLIHYRNPDTERRFWLTPGGGVEVGESSEAALRRELAEETGLDDFALGPLLWTRRRHFDWHGRRVHQREEYFLVRTERFEAEHRHFASAEEREMFVGFRWWSADALATSGVAVAPRSIPSLVQELMRDGAPETPLDLGLENQP